MGNQLTQDDLENGRSEEVTVSLWCKVLPAFVRDV